jgi:hypothetical protein
MLRAAAGPDPQRWPSTPRRAVTCSATREGSLPHAMPHTPPAAITILFMAHEGPAAAAAAVDSHAQAAASGGFPIKIVVLCRSGSSRVAATRELVAGSVANVAFWTYDDLLSMCSHSGDSSGGVAAATAGGGPKQRRQGAATGASLSDEEALLLCLQHVLDWREVASGAISVASASDLVSTAHYRLYRRCGTSGAVHSPAEPTPAAALADVLAATAAQGSLVRAATRQLAGGCTCTMHALVHWVAHAGKQRLLPTAAYWAHHAVHQRPLLTGRPTQCTGTCTVRATVQALPLDVRQRL